MNEYPIQLIASMKLLWVVLFSSLYATGGISNKWLRRYIGPLWMGVGVWIFGYISHSFHWWHLLYPVLLSASLHIGYGGTDNVSIKIRKRVLYGLALGLSALPLCFDSYLWILFGMHVSLCVLSSTLLGVFSAAKNARNEETIIAALSGILPLFLI